MELLVPIGIMVWTLVTIIVSVVGVQSVRVGGEG